MFLIDFVQNLKMAKSDTNLKSSTSTCRKCQSKISLIDPWPLLWLLKFRLCIFFKVIFNKMLGTLQVFVAASESFRSTTKVYLKFSTRWPQQKFMATWKWPNLKICKRAVNCGRISNIFYFAVRDINTFLKMPMEIGFLTKVFCC